MRKCLFVSVIALAVVATTASAVDIKTFATRVGNQYQDNKQDGWNVSALSDDGLYIYADVGTADSNTKASVFKISDGSYFAQAGTDTNARGFGTWVGDGTFTWIANLAGSTTGANAPKAYWIRTNINPGNANRMRTKADVVDASSFSAFNSLSIDSVTGNGWMVGHGINTGKGLAWKIAAGNIVNGGTLANSASWEQSMGSTTTNGGLNGASNAGVGVGLSTYYGASFVDLNWNDIYSVTDITPFAGADANVNNGEAIGVSANAKLGTGQEGFIAGYFKASAWRNAYVLDLSTTAISTDGGVPHTTTAATRLLPTDGDYNGTGDEAQAFDVSNNGIVVGSEWTNASDRTAVVWLPGAAHAVTLESIMLETMTDDVARLVNCVSITAVANPNGSGQDVYTIAGQALMTAGGTRAFVATILPEPATLVFLALGGLAMLRRRR